MASISSNILTDPVNYINGTQYRQSNILEAAAILPNCEDVVQINGRSCVGTGIRSEAVFSNGEIHPA
jgi:hypothetical protein